MPLDAREIARLRRIIAISEKLIATSPRLKRGRPSFNSPNGIKKISSKRTRRTGKELMEFRKELRAELKKGTSVAAIAKKHGVSTAYVYQL